MCSNSESRLIDQIDALLPQTQCTRCGYPGCRPYAQAIAHGQADINRCPPGGQDTVTALAQLLDRPEPPLDIECGTPGPLLVAVIDETQCMGCTLCIQACPVDAITGAAKLMHTVLADQCTGCELCVEPCPVDCIDMVPANREWTRQQANAARDHHQQRQKRLQSRHREKSSLAARTLANTAALTPAAQGNADQRRDTIAQALAKARARRSTENKPQTP